MKIPRNLVIALAVLALLCGGVYWIFFRGVILAEITGETVRVTDAQIRWGKFFAPAIKIDFRLNVDRPLRNYLRGHRINTDTGDFVTVSETEACTFKGGRFRSSGQATFTRNGNGYDLEFQDEQDHPRSFNFTGRDLFNPGRPHDSTSASVLSRTGTLSDSQAHFTKLTRALTPAP